jgi:hypothetical protein
MEIFLYKRMRLLLFIDMKMLLSGDSFLQYTLFSISSGMSVLERLYAQKPKNPI